MSIDNEIPTKSDSMKVQGDWGRASIYNLVSVDEFSYKLDQKLTSVPAE
jgi:hypothetical protein